MAGMLPGVECARRRRFHLSSDNSASPAAGGSSRRTSFCLYTTNHEISHSSLSSARMLKKEYDENEKLEATARQAKERLDERLRTKGRGTREREEKGLKKKFKWGKLRWKSGKEEEEEECSICLERLKTEEELVELPCGHRYHCNCLLPWLQHHAHCPCCRMLLSLPFP